jgi:cytochrome P450
MSVLGTAAYAPLSHAMVENPYAVYIALRADQPVFWYEALGTWVVLDYRSCVDVLRDNNRFARDWRRVGAEVPPTDLSLQNIDPPELHPMRSVVLEAMDVHDQERLRAHLTDVAAARSWQLKDAGPYDYIREIAAPLTLSLTARLLGSSIDRVDDVADIADDIVLSMDAGLDPTRAERGRRAKTSLNQLLRSWLADSTDSGMLAEITRRSDKAGLSTDLAFNTLRVVFASIFVATTGAIGNSVLALLENPDAMAELRAGADPSIAVNELLRFDGPSMSCPESPSRTPFSETSRFDRVTIWPSFWEAQTVIRSNSPMRSTWISGDTRTVTSASAGVRMPASGPTSLETRCSPRAPHWPPTTAL